MERLDFIQKTTLLTGGVSIGGSALLNAFKKSNNSNNLEFMEISFF